MKLLNSRSQRWLKCFHLLFAGTWLGSALGLLVINLFLEAEDGMQLYGINATMKFLDDFVVVPGAIGCFLTGALYSVYTNWGWFKHGWITAKWIVTLYGIVSGTFFLGPRLNSLPPLSRAEGMRVLANQTYADNKLFLYWFGGLQVATLIFAATISVLRPWKRSTSE